MGPAEGDNDAMAGTNRAVHRVLWPGSAWSIVRAPSSGCQPSLVPISAHCSLVHL